MPVSGEVEVDDGFGGTDVFRTEGGRTPRLESNDIGEWIWVDVTDGGWEHLWMGTWDCVRRAVRAGIPVLVIVPPEEEGPRAGRPGCLECPRRTSDCKPGSSYDNCVAVHAEANALLYADREDLTGATIYITRDPCYACSKLIAASGVVRVVTAKGGHPDEPRSAEKVG